MIATISAHLYLRLSEYSSYSVSKEHIQYFFCSVNFFTVYSKQGDEKKQWKEICRERENKQKLCLCNQFFAKNGEDISVKKSKVYIVFERHNLSMAAIDHHV